MESTHGAIYTGGNVILSKDGSQLLCQKEFSVEILNLSQGKVTTCIGNLDDEDFINTFTYSVVDESVITSHKSGLFKKWTKDGSLIKAWKCIHKGPISKLAVNDDGNILASGGSDSSIRLWDLNHQTCTHNLRGLQGVVSVLTYHPNHEKNLVYGAADNTKIFAWDLTTGNEKLQFAGHFSKVTSINFTDDHKYMVSTGRDKVIIVWDSNSGKLIRTVPVFESIESAIVLSNNVKIPGFKKMKDDQLLVLIAGEKGIVRIWDASKPKELYVQENSLVTPASEEGGLSITHLFYNKDTKYIGIVTVDHNILIHKLSTFECLNQIIGFSDEVLDIAYVGSGDSHIAVATNSVDIKLYELSNMNCNLLKGHKDLVLSLAKSSSNPNVLLSSSKDNTIRVWLINSEEQKFNCIAIGSRHTESVGSVALSNLSTDFCVSVSQDSCLKFWKLDVNNFVDEPQQLHCSYTELAHQKDINCVSIAPNDKMIATGSQDKTAKLWSSDGLNLLGIFRGHKRGVWSVRFSPVDQILLTTSADCTMKIWSLSELNCLRTLEGHDSSVLRGEFMSKGMQIITSGADGLIKLWSIKTAECVHTMEKHEGRVWAIAVSNDEEYVISGGSDSLLVKWKDVTMEKKEREAKLQQDLALQEQTLSNLLHSKQLLKALKLAIRLDRPQQVLKIINLVIKSEDKGELSSTIKQLKPLQKEKLFKHASTWNMNSKNCHVAQLVINILLDDIQTGELKPVGFTSILESTIPYTERHFHRLTQLLQDLHFVKYTINCMQPHAKEVNME